MSLRRRTEGVGASQSSASVTGDQYLPMPNRAPKKLKSFARQLLACEAALPNPEGAGGSGPFRACERLRGPLGKFIGIVGFRALLSRALALAGEEAPILRGLHIRADGSLESLETDLRPGEVSAAEAVLVAQITELLVTFIGPALTLQLLRDIWPDIGPDMRPDMRPTIPDHKC